MMELIFLYLRKAYQWRGYSRKSSQLISLEISLEIFNKNLNNNYKISVVSEHFTWKY